VLGAIAKGAVLSSESGEASLNHRTLAAPELEMLARTFILGVLPRLLKEIMAPFCTFSYPGNGWSVTALIRVKLDTEKEEEGGLRVKIPFLEERRAVSLASSLTRYVPRTDGVAPVIAFVGCANVSDPGPRTRDHKMSSVCEGSPSSETVPVSVTGLPKGCNSGFRSWCWSRGWRYSNNWSRCWGRGGCWFGILEESHSN